MVLARALVAVCWVTACSARAVESPPSTTDQAADVATNPIALANTLQLEPRFIVIASGGNATQLLLRLGVAYQALFIPGVKVGDVYSYARLDMFGEALNTPSSPAVVGLQSWQALLLGIKPFAWGAQVGLGVDALLPTATNPALDAQEFELGPSVAAQITRVKHLQLAVLARFFFSVAGASPDLAYVLVQPIVSYHLPKAFFLKTDGIMNFDFRNSPHATVPVNLGFGRAVTTRLSLALTVEGVTVGSGQGNVTVRLNLSYFAW
jgi:hypothetical protein